MNSAWEGPEPTGHRVFISYCTKGSSANTSDKKIAEMICTALESQGIPCWLAPRDILPGADWMDAITDAVDQTKIVVLVFSENTEKSKWVKQEIKLAIDGDKTIIPFRIREVSPQRSLKMLKVSFQWLDAFTPPLEKHIERLVQVVRSHLEKEGEIPPLRIPVPTEVNKYKNEIKQGSILERVEEPLKVEAGKKAYKSKYYTRIKRVLIAAAIIISMTTAVFVISQRFGRKESPPNAQSRQNVIKNTDRTPVSNKINEGSVLVLRAMNA